MIKMIKSLLCVLLLIFDFTLFNVATENNKSEKHRSSPSEENPETESATTTETKATISVENSENVEPLLHKEQNSKGDNLSSAKQVYYIKKVEECKVRSTPLDMIEVHITTRIQGGMELDSSYTSPGGKPLKLGLLGDKNVNALDKAMMGMCEGETVRVAVPVHEVFDKKKLEQAPFPADSILEYDIDLITVIKPPLNEDSFEIIDVDEDGQVSKDEFKEYLEDIGFEEESHFMLDSFFKYKDKSNNSFITMEELKLPYEEAVEEPSVTIEEIKSRKEHSSLPEEDPDTETRATTDTDTSETTSSAEDSQNIELPLHDDQDSERDNVSPGHRISYINKVEDCEVRVGSLDIVEVHITSRIEGGKELDSSYNSPGAKPLKFGLKGEKTLNSYGKAMLGMCEGEVVKVSQPAHVTVDKETLKHAPFQPDSIMEFDIELITIIKPPLTEYTFETIDVDEDGQVSKEEFTEYLEDIGFHEESDYFLHSFFGYKDRNNDNFITMEELTLWEEDKEPKHEEL